ncbi:metallophosphoesterase family protein [Stackebrandtia nassauensis]|uniref:Metallophosphoesterase n=1 Tax=Stackebrandtia nassauensis (strain DSM 44728 / CIP 108903 / NRRL B-16338 / NBRC 102104 / LLR-40K-21) TaxID=446470 RepID=D3Q1P0_STANL|nr:metallophosphoesterase family protein [Stackebrandtia nassauensis]ADD39888.1 metallophosphoesterase [Stackebrandtia nassauensis DSM 44728]
MVSNVVVLSDIHGVLPALEAVLAEPDVRSAERIVLTGDILSGPQPVEVFDTLLGLGERVVWVRGNADRELVEIRRDGKAIPEIPVSEWAAGQLREEHVGLLEGMASTARLGIEGLGEVLFCHATPRDDEEVVLVDSRPARWEEVLAGLDPAVTTVVCGHTHMPFSRLTHGVTVVNAGSIGMPYGRRGAPWLRLGPGIEMRHTEYDYEVAVARIAAESTFPDAAAWADEYVYSRNSERDALAAFGPRDGR